MARAARMSAGHGGSSGYVLSDGRFAVLGGISKSTFVSSFEALTFGADDHWTYILSTHDVCVRLACAAVAECTIVAGGQLRTLAEVYDEVLDQWLRLPCAMPHNGGLRFMGSALM
jgi:hypothetical protein